MAKKFASFAVVVTLAIMVSACNISKSPTVPSDGPPDQSGLEPLPTQQHRLVDTEGNELELWVRLLMIKPDRRSILTLNGPCPPYCFHFQVEVGHSFADGIEGYADFQIGLGQQKDQIDRMLVGARVGRRPGSTLTQTQVVPAYPDQAWVLREIQRYLVIQSVSKICGPDPVYGCVLAQMEIREGRWSFPTEYR